MTPDIAIFSHRWCDYIPRCAKSVVENTCGAYNLLIICEPGNCHENMNRCLDRGHERFLCLLDEDVEILYPGWIEKMIQALIHDPSLAIIGANEIKDRHEALTIQRSYKRGIPITSSQPLTYRPFVAAYTMLIDRERCDGLRFDENIPFRKAMSDWDFCLQARARGYQVAKHPDVFVYHEQRFHMKDDMRRNLDLPTVREEEDAYPDQNKYMIDKWGEGWNKIDFIPVRNETASVSH